jgi:hypothetical protein
VIRGVFGRGYTYSESRSSGEGETNGKKSPQNERQADQAFRHQAPEGGAEGQAARSRQETQYRATLGTSQVRAAQNEYGP